MPINDFRFLVCLQDPDLTVESISLSRSSQTSRPSTSATTSSTTQQVRPPNFDRIIESCDLQLWNFEVCFQNACLGLLKLFFGILGSTGGTSAQANCNVGSLLWDQQTIQFSVNAWV